MTQTDTILTQVLDQLKTLTEVSDPMVTTCKASRAIKILGVNDVRALKHFTEEGLLNRRGTRKGGYVYYIPELTSLRDMIKENPDLVPNLKLK